MLEQDQKSAVAAKAASSNGAAPVSGPLPPGPSSPTPVQFAQRFLFTRRYLRRQQRKHGNIFMLSMPGGERVVLVAEPEAIKQIFTSPPSTFDVGRGANSMLEPLVGSASLLTLDGAMHMRHRKLLLPPLHGERMRSYHELITGITEQDMASWPVGEPFGLLPHTRDLTLSVILQAVFGVEAGARQDELRVALREILDLSLATTAFVPWVRHWVNRPWVQFVTARERMDDLIYKEISRRKQEVDAGQRSDILSLLLEARDEEGLPMTDKELRDELVTMLIAGHETTATSLAWAFDLLLHDSAARVRLVESFGTDDDQFLDAVITETLRLRPVIPQISRKTTAPFQLGPYAVPAKTMISPNIAMLHARADLYPEPDRFMPERFLEEGAQTYSWLPFGGGVRRCAGAAFAQYEMNIVLRTVLERAQLRAADPEPEQVARRAVTLLPRNGTMVVLERPIA